MYHMPMRLMGSATLHKAGADLEILVGGVTLFAIPIIYLQHLFSKFHYELGDPGGGGVKPLSPPPPIRLCKDLSSPQGQFDWVHCSHCELFSDSERGLPHIAKHSLRHCPSVEK